MRPGLTSCWLSLFVALLAAACGGPVRRVEVSSKGPSQGREPDALVVTLSGMLGTKELAHCTRTLREASSRGVQYVVFVLEDSGDLSEDEEDLQSLFDRMQDPDLEVGTVALVKGKVRLGAAYLALLADRTYFQRGATLGVITNPTPQLWDLIAADPDGATAKRFDRVRETLRERLARRRSPFGSEAEKMALAMADPRMQLVRAVVRDGGVERSRVLEDTELADLDARGATIVTQHPFPRPMEVTAAEAEGTGLSLGTVDGLEQLATDALHLDADSLGELSINWAERMIGWLELFEPFLMVLGFLLILFEVKTPGFGLPGVLGAAFLGMAMLYSYLTGLAEITEILVFFLGLAALAVEIFLLPGTLVFGAVGFLCLVLALVLSRQSFVLPSNAAEEEILLTNLTNLTLMFVLVLVCGYLMWKFLPRVPWVNRVMLSPPRTGIEPGEGRGSGLGLRNEDLTDLVGRVGTAETVLHPAGMMELDGRRIDVVTEGEFVGEGTPVRVLFVQGNRVVVAAEGEIGERHGENGSVGVAFLLAIVGLALLVAEVFFVSFGIIAVCAGIALISAVFVGFQVSTGFGVGMMVGEAIAAPIVFALAFRMLPKTRFGKQLILTGPVIPTNAGAADPRIHELLGRTGQTLSDLRPSGFARIDGRKIDVVTRGEMIPGGVDVEVIDVSANRVVVAQRTS